MINVPTLSQRKEILNHQCAELRVDSGLELEVIAQMTNGYVGADLMSLCHEAAFRAMSSLQSSFTEDKVRTKKGYITTKSLDLVFDAQLTYINVVVLDIRSVQ